MSANVDLVAAANVALCAERQKTAGAYAYNIPSRRQVLPTESNVLLPRQPTSADGWPVRICVSVCLSVNVS